MVRVWCYGKGVVYYGEGVCYGEGYGEGYGESGVMVRCGVL